ncbi:MAG: serine/threonine-protein kinase [Myxococcota bacterium]
MTSPCLEENEIVDLVTGALDPEAAAKAEAHIDACPRCRLVLIELARVFELKASALPEPEDSESSREDKVEDGLSSLLPPSMLRGATIGRYLVLETLGAGAMGVVHAAFDPELDRKVALKLLRPRAMGTASSERLVREARATARLAHPNVVVVHDVGLHEGAVFMAMEFVDGGTLGDWLAAQRRDPEATLSMFRDAGLGLEAAHEAGLVHRDFKPANVLVGTDGRARVTDFGLARDGQPEGAREALFSTHSSGAELSDATLTRTGALVGTPAYMSPEQFAGAVADARSDQFSFCVALFEALTGQRPFAGRTITELAANVSAGRIAEPQALDVIARPLRAAILRGLSVEPDDRFPSLGALLRALVPSGWAATRRSTKALFLGGLSLAAVGLGAAASSSAEEPRCASSSQDLLAKAWTPTRAISLEQAFADGGVEISTRAAATLREELDRFAGEWTSSRDAACSPDTSEAARSVSLQCLDDRLVRFGALVEALESSEEGALVHASEAVARLGNPVECTQPDWSHPAIQKPPPDKADAVAAARRRVARISADGQLGNFDTAVEMATSLIEEAEAIDFDPLTAAAYYELGFVQLRRAEYEASLAALEHSFRVAMRCDETSFMVASGSLALHLVSVAAPNLEQAHVWKEMTLAATERAGTFSHAAASYWNSVGLYERSRGNYDEARAAYERSYALHQEFGPEGPETLVPLNNLAALEMDVDDFNAAERRSRELIAELERRYGPEHPDYVPALGTLAAALVGKNEIDEAAETIERALSMGKAWFGPDSARLDSPRAVMAGILKRKGDLEGSKAMYEEILDTWTRTRGPDDSNVAIVHNNLATTLGKMERHEEALDHHREALRIFTKAHGEGHRSVVQANSACSVDAMYLGRCEEAARYLEAADGPANALPETDILGSVVLHNQAKHAFACGGEPDEGLAKGTRAVAMAKRSFGPEHLVVGKFSLSAAELALDADAFDTAREHFETYESLATGTPSAGTRSRVAYVRAALAAQEGRPQDAATHARSALDSVPAQDRWTPLRDRIVALQARIAG